MDTLLKQVKANLILEHDNDDSFLKQLIGAAISYAEGYQHLPPGTYQSKPMSQLTAQGIVMLASHFYESRDGSTGGFFADNTQASTQVWTVVNNLLRMDRDWKV